MDCAGAGRMVASRQPGRRGAQGSATRAATADPSLTVISIEHGSPGRPPSCFVQPDLPLSRIVAGHERFQTIILDDGPSLRRTARGRTRAAHARPRAACRPSGAPARVAGPAPPDAPHFRHAPRHAARAHRAVLTRERHQLALSAMAADQVQTAVFQDPAAQVPLEFPDQRLPLLSSIDFCSLLHGGSWSPAGRFLGRTHSQADRGAVATSSVLQQVSGHPQ
jgi:hypothetical protein